MAEKDPNNANDGGEQSDNQGPGDEKTFTQAEVNQLMGDRVARERAKYTDYDDLKAKAVKLQGIEDAQKSELQKAQEALETAQRAGKAAIAIANTRLVRAEFIAQAANAGAQHPEDAYALADSTVNYIAEDGKVTGVTERVAALVETGRLVMSGRPKPPNLNGGAGGGDRGDTVSATPQQIEAARNMRIPIDEYMKYVPKT